MPVIERCSKAELQSLQRCGLSSLVCARLKLDSDGLRVSYRHNTAHQHTRYPDIEPRPALVVDVALVHTGSCVLHLTACPTRAADCRLDAVYRRSFAS